MKKHSLGFEFHLLIVYLVSVTLVYAQGPSSRFVKYLPTLIDFDESSIQGYVPAPGERIFPGVSAPSKRIFSAVSAPSERLFPAGKRGVSAPSKRIFPAGKRFSPGVSAPSKRIFNGKSLGKDGPSVNPISIGGGTGASGGGGGRNGSGKSWSTRVVVTVAGSVGVVVLFTSLLSVSVYELGKRKGSSVVPYQNTSRHSTSDRDQVTIMIDGYDGVGQTSRGIHVEAGNKAISIQDLQNATNNFSQENILGRGGSATVYKGELHDGTQIAVKRMKPSDSGGLDEFQSEIAVLTKVRHRHLVALLGYCLDGNERLLVYEYMPQGTLSRFLFDWKREGLKPLEWRKRLIIALDVARGVEYLHSLAQKSFIHRDFKPCNILLGDDIRAKVADFGLVRSAPQGEYSLVSRLAGTIGYLAPEYSGMGQVTTKIDVYSFGVILMELITGRRARDTTQKEIRVPLVIWFRQMYKDEVTFPEVIDFTLDLDEDALAGVSVVAKLAHHCCATEPHQRPNMNHVVNVLSSLAEPWNPSKPDSDDSYGINLDEEALASVTELCGPSTSNAYNF